VISTVAGGVGGPATATTVALDSPCGVSCAAGRADVADGYDARVLNTTTDALLLGVWTVEVARHAGPGPAVDADFPPTGGPALRWMAQPGFRLW
jgi:hypothetical protein